MAPKKKANKAIGKKDMKKTKGGLLPAVNLQHKDFKFFSPTANLDPALKYEWLK